MNIPKKLPTNSQNYGSEIKLELVRIKVDEIISYLQAKENKSYKAASSICCDSSFRLEGDTKEGTMFHVCNNCNKSCDIQLKEKKVEASKKDKYLCYTCNQWGIVGEHKCEASKGECGECLLRNHALGRDTFPGKQKEDNPPEQEEIPHGYKLRHDDCEDCIKVTGDAWQPKMSEYVSKEKIREYVLDRLNCYSNTDYRVALTDLLKSLGLGE